LADTNSTISRPRVPHLAHHGLERIRREEEIDEARPCDLDLGHQPRGRQMADQLLGDGAGRLSERLGHDQRQVGGEVTVACVFRRVDLQAGGPLDGTAERRGQRCQRLVQQRLQFGFHRGSRGIKARRV
jgi:hypothetical protein